MTDASNIEARMLAAALQTAYTYRDQDPQDLKTMVRTLMDWTHGDEKTRREIYAAWRNADNGPANSETY